jgi:hypothetical protein
MSTLKFKDGSIEITEADIKAIPYFATLMESKFPDAETFQLEDITVAEWQVYRGIKPDSSLPDKFQALRLADRLMDSKCLTTILDHVSVTRQDINLWVSLLAMSGQLIMESPNWPLLQTQVADCISLGLPDEIIAAWSKDLLRFTVTEFKLSPVVQLDLLTQWFMCNGVLNAVKLPIQEAFKTKAPQLPLITARLMQLGRMDWLTEALQATVGSVENFTLRQPENLRIVDYRDFDITKLSFGEVEHKLSPANQYGHQGKYDSQSCLYEGQLWVLAVPDADVKLADAKCGPSLKYTVTTETKGWSHLETVLREMTAKAVLAVPESRHGRPRPAQTYSHQASWTSAYVGLKLNSLTKIHDHMPGELMTQRPGGYHKGHDILLSFYLWSCPEMGRLSLIRQLRQVYIEF